MGVNDGAYYATVSLSSSSTYTFSVDFWGVNGVSYKIYFATTGGSLKGTATNLTGTGDWQRVEVTWTADSTSNFRLYFTKNNSNSTASVWVDGLQLEAQTYATSYCDGDQPGCKWTRALHASTSQRDGQSREGGREYNLDTYAFYLTETPGIGMPAQRHLTQGRAFLPGQYFKGSKVQPRTFDLVAEQIGSSRPDLHNKRRQLIDAIKPDLVKDEQAVILKYTGANSAKPVSIQAVYDTGFGFTEPEGFSEKIAARFIAYENPFWTEEGDQVAHLSYSQEIVNANRIVAKISNSWQVPSGTGADGTVRAFAEDGDGNIYAVGDFANIGGVAAAYVAKYNGTSWSALGGGLPGAGYCVAVAPNGDVYAGGDTYAKRWNGSTWADLGTGPNDIVYAVAIDQVGNVYLGGLFTTFDGATVNYVCMWDGASATALISGMGARVVSLAIGHNNVLYAGGYATADGEGNTINYIASWDGSEWSALASGLDSTVNIIMVGPNGLIYVGGFFTLAGSIEVNYIAVWNGTSWYALGSGLNDVVYHLGISPNTGILYASGNFTAAGDLDIADRAAIWNGYTWAHLDIFLPGSSPAQAVFVAANDDLYFGFGDTGSAHSSYVNSVTNSGTRSAYPVVVFSRSGGTSAIVKWLKNETTGATLYLNYSLLSGEKLTLDFSLGKRSVVSNYFGSSLRALLRNSDVGKFNLLPGANNLSCLVTAVGSPTVEAYMLWQNNHWSVDGVATS